MIAPTFKKIKKKLQQQKALKECARKFKVAGDLTRLRICYLLIHYPGLKVTELAQILGISQSAVSHALSKMKRTVLLQNEKIGRRVHYKMNSDKYTRILAKVLSF